MHLSLVRSTCLYKQDETTSGITCCIWTYLKATDCIVFCMGVVLNVAERAKINRKVRLGTRCVDVGRSGEVPLYNGSIYGRHSVPCVMAVVESLAALRRPAVYISVCMYYLYNNFKSCQD